MTRIFRFLISRVFWVNVVIALVVIAGLVWATFLWLEDYTRHDMTVTVPNFIGQDMHNLDAFVVDKEVDYLIIDSIFDLKRPKGSVVSQTPPPDFQVKQNRKIYLTVIATSKEKVEIKNYKGVSLRQAMSMLETRGLLLDSIVTRPYDFEGTVLGLEYEGLPLDSGSTIEKGTAVSIVVGAGLGKSKVLLPNLVGRTFAQARNELNAKGLNARLPYCPSCPSPYDPPDSAQVVLQEPEYEEGESINLGSGVKLELSLEFDPNLVSGDTTVSYPDTTQSPNPLDE